MSWSYLAQKSLQYTVVESFDALAINPFTVCSELRLPTSYLMVDNCARMAGLIRHTTDCLERATGVAIVPKVISVSHNNLRIPLPLRSVHSVNSVSKFLPGKSSKAPSAQEVDPKNYTLDFNVRSMPILTISSSALTKSEQARMGLIASADTSGNKIYCKSGEFVVTYQAGSPEPEVETVTGLNGIKYLKNTPSYLVGMMLNNIKSQLDNSRDGKYLDGRHSPLFVYSLAEQYVEERV